MKRIVADRTRCVGGGNCVMSAPDLFWEGEDDGLVLVIKAALAIIDADD